MFNGEFLKQEDLCYEIKTSYIIYSFQTDQYNLLTYSKCHKYSSDYKIRTYDVTIFLNTTTNFSEVINTDSIESTIESTISSEGIDSTNIMQTTEINVIPSTILTDYSEISESTEKAQESTENKFENDSTEQTERTTYDSENDSTEQTERITYESENDSTEQTERTTYDSEKDSTKPTEKLTELMDIVDTTEEFRNCIDDKKVKDNNGKCICDDSKHYYYINNNNLFFDENCYNEQTKPENFYLNKENKIYEMCYKNCKTCENHGNDLENNCTSCINNYISLKDINNITNCFPKCNYYYFFNKYNIFTCTSTFKCPDEEKLLIRNKGKCIDNCQKDEDYKYQYSGECFEKCPNGTNSNDYKCEVVNTNLCSLSVFQNLTFKDLINNNIDFYAKN